MSTATAIAAALGAPLPAVQAMLRHCGGRSFAAALIAQCAHESANFTRTRESLNYTPEALRRVWPNRFTPDEARRMGRIPGRGADQMQIANKAYNGRMGNEMNSSDGWRYRGGGYIQLTGKANYTKYASICDVPIRDHPEEIEHPDTAARVAVAYWDVEGLTHILDTLGFDAVSNRINTGRVDRPAHGLEDRRMKYELVQMAMGA